MKNSNKTEKICSCPVETTTTHREHFLPYGKITMPIRAKLQKPCDIELISGHIANNLQWNNQQIKSKIWPEMQLNAENYEDFLKRFKYCKKDLFKLYFESPKTDKKIIDEIFKNINKTSYQVVFSPKVFTPSTEKRRFAKLEKQPVRMKYEETTYRTYFERIKELENFKEIWQGVALKENKLELKNDLKEILHCGRTTYHDEILLLGKLYTKPTMPGPIDRYALRRI
ncbi:hypothetical protein FF38_07865 [Lucilia cuprina]|uniref:Uncharacterized protein n=1 Tax=Lucilia cuprina TaxID=7375 RepID=A0A0L0C068_LUCCU|nr:hypothetical protein CVS40_0796 [Lucilia cuprina]KNC24854.1 hypothetical protein FF38_07865 [Lucilia cuprina]